MTQPSMIMKNIEIRDKEGEEQDIIEWKNELVLIKTKITLEELANL